ncbi:hypothetical protein SAMN05216389_11132 [Oceanobacillus limi]|uniref:DUF7448 domain-containing protein n=1 Tax=Oceanobacillus limi TaxID=930131 RepID=A0A1I0EBN3_9BACI|nr:hypothetical protein [Oceanobacillus limi]SET42682.1 hypothetical protein SAMN05216389_11132 [Oceanobacillus limi]
MYDVDYSSLEEIREMILYKRVISVTDDEVHLENGVKLTIECSEWDCCAGGGGTFSLTDGEIPLDAVITDINVDEQKDVPDDDTTVSENTITIFHNQNPIIEANATTDAGNGGYYYSVTSLVVNGAHFPFVRA